MADAWSGPGPETAVLKTFRASDGYNFYYRHYEPAGRPRGQIIFVHGIRSHGGWYLRSCRELAAQGYDVTFLDRRGSGLNTAHRGDTPSFRRLLDDVVEYVQMVRDRRPWLPVVLGGISWGGKLAVGLPYRAPRLLHGVMLLCPGLCPRVAPSLMERINIGRARWRNPTRFFPIPLNEAELFTADPHWQQYVMQDRHGLTHATARFLFSSAQFDVYLRRAVKRLTIPSLALLAEHDRIIDNTRTRNYLAAARKLTAIEYSGAHHTLEFEPHGHPFVTDICQWLNTNGLG